MSLFCKQKDKCSGSIKKMKDKYGSNTFCATLPKNHTGSLKKFFLGYPPISLSVTNIKGTNYDL